MNLKSLKASFGRFKGLPWFAPISKSRIFIGGAGGIGSHLAFQLARTGASLYIIDPDTVEEQNLAGQLYTTKHIGDSKSKAIESLILDLCPEAEVEIDENWITEEDGDWRYMVERFDVVTVGFDNLKARRLVYDQWRKTGKEQSLFVDGRLAAESGQVFVLPKNSTDYQFEQYEATYFSDEERTELPCTMKATTHCGALIASFMVSQITNWLNNLNPNNFPRTVSNIEFHLAMGLIEYKSFLRVKPEIVEEVEEHAGVS